MGRMEDKKKIEKTMLVILLLVVGADQQMLAESGVTHVGIINAAGSFMLNAARRLLLCQGPYRYVGNRLGRTLK